jgi:two-component system chemotaxis response regulator CheB
MPNSIAQRPNGQRVVAIGSSAGGIEGLEHIVAALPADFPAPIFIVQHISPEFPSMLPQMLARAGKLPVKHPRDGEIIRAPHVYVAPPDHHLLIEDGHIGVARGPRENRFRPSIDALFRSAAYVYGSAAIGVVLSGALSDGTSGLWTIKRLGGVTMVQRPDDAPVASMPMSALQNVEIDHSLPVRQIAEVLMSIIKRPVPHEISRDTNVQERLEAETAIASGAYALEKGSTKLGAPSRYSCPECHGVLAKIEEGRMQRFRCHTGHAYTQEALLSGIKQSGDDRMAEALTTLEEHAMLLSEIGSRCMQAGRPDDAAQYLSRARKVSNSVRELHALASREKDAAD